jgi:signal transduction histidine kinase
MIHATAGQSGTTRASDYRQARVIAAYRPVSLTGWGIVVKQDVAETLTSVKRLQNILIIGLVVLLLFGAVAIFLLVKNFMRPLGDLETAARKVAQGDLSTRVPVATNDEVGRLAESFNAMVGHLETTRSDLERRNQELTSFAYVVSHDLKAPLRSLGGLATVLEEDLADVLDDTQRSRLELMRDRVRRLELMVAGLLELSRVENSMGPVTAVDLKKLLGSVVVSVDPPEGFQISFPEDLPVIETREMALGQVFQHLIRNAVDHHPGPEGRIKIEVEEKEGSFEFRVSDDGSGIDPRYHERIFDVFQALTSWDEGQNTGIGLAIVKKTVEEFGGRVWVESEGSAGRGATFVFTWPTSMRSAGN